MATWDLFHSDRLEVERSLSTAAIRAGLARGEIHEDDLARPAGTTIPWARVADLPALMEPEATQPLTDDGPARPEKETDEVPFMPQPTDDDSVEAIIDFGDDAQAPPASAAEEPIADAIIDEDDDEQDEDDDEIPPFTDVRPATTEDLKPDELRDNAYGASEFDLDLNRDERVALPAATDAQDPIGWEPEEFEGEDFDPLDEDEEAAEFSLSRSGPQHIEELDLAAMVDVAFQMVLFFMVTATTVLYKTLEVPKTPQQDAPGAVAQGQQRKTLDDMKNDFILVEIDPSGNIKIDHEPAGAEGLADRLRAARKDTGRKSMLLSADFTTPHRNAVLAYDAANEIGLGIAIAKPAGPGGGAAPPAGAPPPAPTAKGAAGG